jgi:hypothetical protein
METRDLLNFARKIPDPLAEFGAWRVGDGSAAKNCIVACRRAAGQEGPSVSVAALGLLLMDFHSKDRLMATKQSSAHMLADPITLSSSVPDFKEGS